MIHKSETKQKFRRDFLCDQYAEKVTKNPAYSLRAFAKSLKLDPSTLSQYIKGKRAISEKQMFNICATLNVDFLEFAKSEQRYSVSASSPKALDVSLYELRAKWFYFAILELTQIKNFQPDAKWIAQKLGLKTNIAEFAIERLFQLGALKLTSNGKWQDTLTDVTFITSENMDIQAGRQHQKQLLELAAKSIDQNSGDKKDHTGLCLAFDQSLIPEIKLKIAEFRRELSSMIQDKSKNIDSVYCTQINFFPLSETEEKEISDDT